MINAHTIMATTARLDAKPLLSSRLTDTTNRKAPTYCFPFDMGCVLGAAEGNIRPATLAGSTQESGVWQ